MLSRDCERTLRRALAYASARQHEVVTIETLLLASLDDGRADAGRHAEATLEHLLLALLDDPDARDALRQCGADIENLRSEIAAQLDAEPMPRPREARPAKSVQRVVQGAVMHVGELRRPEVTGANILVELFSEADSRAVRFLAEHGIGRLQVGRAIIEHRQELKELS